MKIDRKLFLAHRHFLSAVLSFSFPHLCEKFYKEKRLAIIPGVSSLYICNTCYRSAQKYKKRALDGFYFECLKLPFTWTISTFFELIENAGKRKKDNGLRGICKLIGAWTTDSICPAESHNYGFASELSLTLI